MRVAPYYSAAKNVRPGTDPVVLIKMVLLQHLFGIPSLRQTHRECEVNVVYRWFLGYMKRIYTLYRVSTKG